MKTSLRFAMLACFIVISVTAFSQEWTKAQHDVLQVVQERWSNWKSGDLAAFGRNIHEKYQGWSNMHPLPLNKEQWLKNLGELKEKSKIENYDLYPARITVTENAAVVDYYCWLDLRPLAGDTKPLQHISAKNVEFYVREGSKWLLIGDMAVMNDGAK